MQSIRASLVSIDLILNTTDFDHRNKGTVPASVKMSDWKFDSCVVWKFPLFILTIILIIVHLLQARNSCVPLDRKVTVSADVHESELALSKSVKITSMLLKQRRYWRTWTSRFFVLDDDVLYYYVDKSSHYPRGTCNIKECLVTSKYVSSTLQEINIANKPTGVCWKLTSTDHDLLLRWLRFLTVHQP